ncbi:MULTISPECIES: hypothetical protein [Brevundimonas]|nr:MULTISPECIES: hypothetical protein [Brevundimonas]
MAASRCDGGEFVVFIDLARLVIGGQVERFGYFVRAPTGLGA